MAEAYDLEPGPLPTSTKPASAATIEAFLDSGAESSRVKVPPDERRHAYENLRYWCVTHPCGVKVAQRDREVWLYRVVR